MAPLIALNRASSSDALVGAWVLGPALGAALALDNGSRRASAIARVVTHARMATRRMTVMTYRFIDNFNPVLT